MSKITSVYIYWIAKKRYKQFYEEYLHVQILPSLRELEFRNTLGRYLNKYPRIFILCMWNVVDRKDGKYYNWDFNHVLCALSQFFAYLSIRTMFHWF